MERFCHGNCQDACVGTMLAAAGVEDPAALLFRRLIFRISMRSGDRPTIEYAADDYFTEIADATGVELAWGRASNADELLVLVDELLAARTPVAVSVDHYAYFHSQYCGLAHRPHFVILASAENSRYDYVDPFPRYDVESSVALEDLKQWCCSPISPPLERYRYIYVQSMKGVPFQANAYRRTIWSRTLVENVQSMLSAASNHAVMGVPGIRQLSLHLTAALDRSTEDAARLLSAMPDIGASRLEHGRWLQTSARLVGSVAAGDSGAELQQIARQWDLIAAVAQEHDISTRSGQSSRPFLERKLKRLPALVSLLADREEHVMRCLADII
jgi:hypothetical protein